MFVDFHDIIARTKYVNVVVWQLKRVVGVMNKRVGRKLVVLNVVEVKTIGVFAFLQL